MTSESELPAWLSAVGAAAVGAIGGFLAALINRGPAIANTINSRIEILVTAQAKHITDLTKELHTLRDKVDDLTLALQVRNEHCHACEHWQDIIQPELERIGGGCRNIPPDAI
jgi:hypothetical protein